MEAVYDEIFGFSDSVITDQNWKLEINVIEPQGHRWYR